MSSDTTSSSNLFWNFEYTYLRLPEVFYSLEVPEEIPQPNIVLYNKKLAQDLSLPFLEDETLKMLLSGQKRDHRQLFFSQSYAGHQFGHFTNLGDGRALILGEHVTPSGERLDIQLKGSGKTAYSRRGDGKAALGPMLREYIVSEAMHALGIPTTRSLAVIRTGENVYREDLLPGAILTRIAKSHIRVGTFEYAAALGNNAYVKQLLEYSIQRHMPDLYGLEDAYVEFVRQVVVQQARLIAQWQSIGFVHGVMNTDNMLISGETIDYGPCAFMDTYHPQTVFSSIDRAGRYAYENQPRIGKWNLARFLECVFPLFLEDKKESIRIAEEILDEYDSAFVAHYRDRMRKKIGICDDDNDEVELYEDLLCIMQQDNLDFTNTFRFLSEGEDFCLSSSFASRELDAWKESWQRRVTRNGKSIDLVCQQMRKVNPSIIPRNYIVEEVLAATVIHSETEPLSKLLDALKNPFVDASSFLEYSTPPPKDFYPYKTFCGT